MKAVLVLASCVTLVASAKLRDLLPQSSQRGYDYTPPQQPSGLYDVPAPPPPPPTTTTTTTTTTTPPPPPPPPVDGYLPPVDEVPAPAENNPSIALPPTPAPMGKMLMPYDFNWGVDDEEYGTRMAHVENSDGQNTQGEYRVLLPDGRMQVVKFQSDPVNGYRAEVTYN